MLQRILNYFRSPASGKRLFVPSSLDLPELWSGNDTTPRLEILNAAPTSTLTALCDDYWNSFLTDDDEVSIVRDSQVCRRALEIIASRGTEGLQWARQRLTHPGYDAREDSASLIAQWAQRGLLGTDKEAIAEQLAILAVTPPQEDSKEAQAASAAFQALSIIGGPALMKSIRHVLTSSDWQDDDNQWDCTEMLANLTNEPFMDAADPVAAARAWLEAYPE